MSEMEIMKGKLKFITSDVESFCANKCKEINVHEMNFTWYETLLENIEPYTYAKINDKLYEIEHIQELDPYGHVLVSEHEDKSISFDIHFYNGGGSWTEVIESGIKNT